MRPILPNLVQTGKQRHTVVVRYDCLLLVHPETERVRSFAVSTLSKKDKLLKKGLSSRYHAD